MWLNAEDIRREIQGIRGTQAKTLTAAAAFKSNHFSAHDADFVIIHHLSWLFLVKGLHECKKDFIILSSLSLKGTIRSRVGSVRSAK